MAISRENLVIFLLIGFLVAVVGVPACINERNQARRKLADAEATAVAERAAEQKLAGELEALLASRDYIALNQFAKANPNAKSGRAAASALVELGALGRIIKAYDEANYEALIDLLDVYDGADPLAAKISREMASHLTPTYMARIRVTAEEGKIEAAKELISRLTSRYPKSIQAAEARALVPKLKGMAAAVQQRNAEAFRRSHDVEIKNWSCRDSYGFTFVEGQITNLTTRPIENVSVLAQYYTEDGDFISSGDALVDYNPLLAGQTSPFKVYGGQNPAIRRCKVTAKILFGDSLKTYIKPSK